MFSEGVTQRTALALDNSEQHWPRDLHRSHLFTEIWHTSPVRNPEVSRCVKAYRVFSSGFDVFSLITALVETALRSQGTGLDSPGCPWNHLPRSPGSQNFGPLTGWKLSIQSEEGVGTCWNTLTIWGPWFWSPTSPSPTIVSPFETWKPWQFETWINVSVWIENHVQTRQDSAKHDFACLTCPNNILPCVTMGVSENWDSPNPWFPMVSWTDHYSNPGWFMMILGSPMKELPWRLEDRTCRSWTADWLHVAQDATPLLSLELWLEVSVSVTYRFDLYELFSL